MANDMNDSINEKLINIEAQIENIELQIKRLTDSLYLVKREVQSWVETNSDLSISAQKARAETQAMGRGLDGLLFGSKYRGAVRQNAATKNAEIAKQVAQKREQIRDGKQIAQNKVRTIQEQIRKLKGSLKSLKEQKKDLKDELKNLNTEEKRNSAKQKQSVRETKNEIKSGNDSMEAAKKLYDLYQMGILTKEEYDVKVHTLYKSLQKN